ncbi:hypothetical protein HPB50_004592 [Hyalomma asiaticum]|uniref:Uncharacterized protein n=1 Tax=Hyalomma asiaticum TaxID=266040 RepID=A0ACB7TCQ4_HYAAI|nr:hypothetical protein HPB50_004592 [Hyalomma asiaticum]
MSQKWRHSRRQPRRRDARKGQHGAFQMHLLSSPPASSSEGEPIDRRIRDDDRRDQTTGVTERQQWRQQGPLCLFSRRPTRRSVLFPSVRRPGCEPRALIPLSDLLCCRRSECALAQPYSAGAGEPSFHARDTHESHNSGRPLTRYNGSEPWKCTPNADFVRACDCHSKGEEEGVWLRFREQSAPGERAPLATSNYGNEPTAAATDEDEYIYTLLA